MDGEGENTCKNIWKEIFDKYKKEGGGNSWAGKEAAQKICDAMEFAIAHHGKLRKQYIERSWNGIGDENWRWMA